MSVKYERGDLLGSDCTIRCHQVNCRGVMGAGIAKQIKAKYPEVFHGYQAMCKRFGCKMLGEVQFIPCHDGTIIANLFAQDAYGTDKPQTDMRALEECLERVSAFAAKTGASVGFPKFMGAALAGGDWEKIASYILAYFGNEKTVCKIVEWDQTAKTPPVTSKPKPAKVPCVTMYTDGSCLGNPGPGGWSCILVDKTGREKELVGGCVESTNNRMELTAVIEGLKALSRPCQVSVISDSSYVVNAITKGWLDGWAKHNWKKKGEPLKNVDLWVELHKLLSKHKVTFIWVKGHADNPNNNRCDELARAQARAYSS